MINLKLCIILHHFHLFLEASNPFYLLAFTNKVLEAME